MHGLNRVALAQEKGRVSAGGCYHWQFPTFEWLSAVSWLVALTSFRPQAHESRGC